MSLVGFCGSRSLPSPSSALVSRVVGAVLAAPGDRGVAVGCCVGADQAVISSVLAVPGAASRLSVFAAFGPVSPPWPAPRVSAPGASSSVSWSSGVGAACHAGASVRWWAGGGPAVPMAGRAWPRARQPSSPRWPLLAPAVASSPSSATLARLTSYPFLRPRPRSPATLRVRGAPWLWLPDLGCPSSCSPCLSPATVPQPVLCCPRSGQVLGPLSPPARGPAASAS